MRLAAKDVRKSFGALAALGGVSLEIADSEIVGIAGPNGAGKSTLFDVLSGHTHRDHGTVEIDGRDVTHAGAHARARRGLGRTFQSPIVPTELTVDEVLDAARVAWRPPVDRGTVGEVVELLGLDVPGDTRAGLLDTLARRKLLMACLLMRRPIVLMLDEPCSGLLEDEIEEMEAVIARSREQTGLSVMVVEHRLELLQAIADRVIVMDQGCIIAEGDAEQVFNAPAVREAYFNTAPSAA